jgi:protoporphyrinogen oxidase
MVAQSSPQGIEGIEEGIEKTLLETVADNGGIMVSYAVSKFLIEIRGRRTRHTSSHTLKFCKERTCGMSLINLGRVMLNCGLR